MPHVSITIPEIEQSVCRPVILDIVKQVQQITKIDTGAEVFFPGDIQRMRTPGSSIDDKTERHAIFEQKRIVFIEVEEDYDPEAIGTTAVNRQEHIPVFEDKKLNVYVTPVYITSNVSINVRYRSTSKTEALRWRDDIRLHLSKMRDINLHSVSYHYPIPNAVLTLLSEIHKLREQVEPYGQNVREYITGCSTDRLTVVSDVVGQSARLVVAETQCRIQGLFDFNVVPDKPERDDATGVWTVTFRYKFNYERPLACNLSYPVMVHNQLLPKDYVDFTNDAYNLNKVNKSFSKSLSAFNSFELGTTMNHLHNPELIIRIPSYDDFRVPDVLRGTGSVFFALCEVDATDKISLLNLNELGDIAIDPDILQFIQESERTYITKLYSSILNLTLYRDEFMASQDSLICDANLNVKATRPLNLRRQHRVRLSVTVDLSLLQGDAIYRLRQYPKALVKIISSMNEFLKFNPDFVNLGNESRISEYHFSEIYGMLTGHAYKGGQIPNGFQFAYGSRNDSIYRNIDPRVIENYRRNRVNRNTVMISSMVAIRKDDL